MIYNQHRLYFLDCDSHWPNLPLFLLICFSIFPFPAIYRNDYKGDLYVWTDPQFVYSLIGFSEAFHVSSVLFGWCTTYTDLMPLTDSFRTVCFNISRQSFIYPVSWFKIKTRAESTHSIWYILWLYFKSNGKGRCQK